MDSLRTSEVAEEGTLIVAVLEVAEASEELPEEADSEMTGNYFDTYHICYYIYSFFYDIN